MLELETALSFDDILLKPKHSYVKSRNDLNTNVKLFGKTFNTPIISANMTTVTECAMVDALNKVGGLGIIHRMLSIDKTKVIVANLNPNSFYGISIGIGDDWKTRVDSVLKYAPFCVCLDVANAHNSNVSEVVLQYFKEFKIPLIVGNIATSKAFHEICDNVSDSDLDKIAVKVGIGSGSACTTRIKTGFGLPTLASLLDIKQNRYNSWVHGRHSSVPIIADGGMKNSGDIVKAICAGANSVMLGNMLAGTKESPGEIIIKSDSKYKIYRGSASFEDKESRGDTTKFIEGVESLIKYKGSVLPILQELKDGILSGISYGGFEDLEDMRKNGGELMVRITQNGHRESLPHDLV